MTSSPSPAEEVVRFARIGDLEEERPVVERGGTFYDITGLTNDIDGKFLASGGIARVMDALAQRELPPLRVTRNDRFGAPIARPQAVICVGQNYAAHAAESGDAPPDQPVMFLKHPNTVVGPFDDVPLPTDSSNLDWEVELGVVMGRSLRYAASIQEALSAVAGYVVSNDVTEREHQFVRSGGQWSKGKCGDSFNPLGPYLVPQEFVRADALHLWSKVNDLPRQDSSTSDMVFSVGELLLDLSRYMRLEAGDLINTGTPEGVALSGRFPYLRVGDTVELGIDGLGSQRQRVTAHAGVR